MQYKITTRKTCLIILTASTNIQAQEWLTSAGNTIIAIEAAVSNSIGHLVHTTTIGSNGNIAQWVQQAYEISFIWAINCTVIIPLQYLVYPNPACHLPAYKPDNSEAESLRLYIQYQLSTATTIALYQLMLGMPQAVPIARETDPVYGKVIK